MTLNEWKTLSAGMTIYRVHNSRPREVLAFNEETLCVTLKAVRKTKFGHHFTVYSNNERSLFALMPVYMDPPKQPESLSFADVIHENRLRQLRPIILTMSADVTSGSEMERLLVEAHVQQRPLNLENIFVADVSSTILTEGFKKRTFELVIGQAKVG
jgi:hypothetical protein